MSEQKIAAVLSDDDVIDALRPIYDDAVTEEKILEINLRQSRAIEQLVLARVGAVREQALEDAAHQLWLMRARPEFEPDESDRLLDRAMASIRALKGTPAAAVDGGWYWVNRDDGPWVPAKRERNHWNSVGWSGIPLHEVTMGGALNFAPATIPAGFVPAAAYDRLQALCDAQAESALAATEAGPNYERMFNAACLDLAAINEKLGLDPDDGGATPIIDEIDALLARARPAAAVADALPTHSHDLKTSGGATAFLLDYFSTSVGRHDFSTYIRDRLAKDFACALAQHLDAPQPSSNPGPLSATRPIMVTRTSENTVMLAFSSGERADLYERAAIAASKVSANG